MPADSSRREFLTGRSAVRALAEVRDKLAPPLPPPESEQASRSYLVSVSRDAMACTFEIALNAGQYPGGTDAAVEALDLVDRLEDQLTIYREQSELSRLNRRAASEAVVVERGLFDLLTQAKRQCDETGGAVDITSGALMKTWGFYRRQGQMPTQAEIDEALSRVSSQHLVLDDAAQSVRFARLGIELNLGAIGKGYALDRAAAHLESQGVGDFLIHGGASSVLARGSRDAGRGSGFRVQGSEERGQRSEVRGQETGDREQETGGSGQQANPQSEIRNPQSTAWLVALKHPLKPDERLAEFTLQNQALGTSGSGTQFFHYQGKRYGHILDPRTGWPADKVLAATVIAPTAALADALSTAFYVGGIELAEAYCQSHPEISALLVIPAARSGAIDLVPVNLKPEQWRLVYDGPSGPSR
ncbi:MAG TPA: FAD:protein FMN transferase [Pirellulaceae bacterium]|nr:FAD:protein FMN transferase [Pirellulaceae bacterium]